MTLDRDLQIKRLLADLDAALAASSDGAEEVRSPRALVEQVRAHLAGVAEPPAGAASSPDSSWVKQSWDALSPDLQASGASGAAASASNAVRDLTQSALQSIQQDIDRLRQETIAPMQLDLEALRHQRQSLGEEITQLENQRQYYQSLAQQQANQEQLIGDFLQQLRDRLQTSISEQVSQLVAQSPESAPDAADLAGLETSASGVLDRLQTTLGAIVTALQTNSQRYEESLNAALERMHVLGEESEAVLDHWLSRLASTLGRDLPAEPTTLADEGGVVGGGGLVRPSLTATSLAMPPLPPPTPEQTDQQAAATPSLTDLTYDDGLTSPDPLAMAALTEPATLTPAESGTELADVDFATLDGQDQESMDRDLWGPDGAAADQFAEPSQELSLAGASLIDLSGLPSLPEFPVAGAIAPVMAVADGTEIETREPTLIGGLEDEIFSDVDAIFQLPETLPPESLATDDSPEAPMASDWDPLAAIVTGTLATGAIATGAIATALTGKDDADPLDAEPLPLVMDVGVAAPNLDYDAEPDWDAAPPLPAGQSVEDMTDEADDTNLDVVWESPLPTEAIDLATPAAELQAVSPSDDLLTGWGGGGLPDGGDVPTGLTELAAMPDDGGLDTDIDFEALETSQSQWAAPELEPEMASEAALPNFDDWSVGADADLEGVDLTGDPASDLAEEWDQIVIEPPAALVTADPEAIGFDDAPPPMAAELASESDDLGGDLRAELSAWQQPEIADEPDTAALTGSAGDALAAMDELAPIELEPDVMSAFDLPPDPAVVVEPNSMFEGSWSDATEVMDDIPADDQPMELLPDLGDESDLDDLASTDLGAIELDGAPDSLVDADDLGLGAEQTAEITAEAALPLIALPDQPATLEDDDLSLDLTADEPDSSTDLGDDLLPGLDLPDDGVLEDSNAAAGFDADSASLWQAELEAGDDREAGLEAIAGLRDDPTFGSLSEAGGLDEEPPMEVDWAAALAAPEEVFEGQPEGAEDLDGAGAVLASDSAVEQPDLGLDQDLGWEAAPDRAIDTELELDAELGSALDVDEPSPELGAIEDLGDAWEPDLGLDPVATDAADLDLGWAGGGGDPTPELALDDSLGDPSDYDLGGDAAIEALTPDWPAEAAIAESDPVLGDDLFGESLDQPDLEGDFGTDLGATSIPDPADPDPLPDPLIAESDPVLGDDLFGESLDQPDLEGDFGTDLGATSIPDPADPDLLPDPLTDLALPDPELAESLDQGLAGLAADDLDLGDPLGDADAEVEALGDWSEALPELSGVATDLSDGFTAEVDAAPEAIEQWDGGLDQSLVADQPELASGAWGDLSLETAIDDAPVVLGLQSPDPGVIDDLGDDGLGGLDELTELGDLGELGGSIDPAPEISEMGWSATADAPAVLGLQSSDPVVIDDLGDDGLGGLDDLTELGDLDSAIDPAPEMSEMGWPATADLPSDLTDEDDGIDNLDFGLVDLNLDPVGDGLPGLEDDADLTLADLTANPLEIQSLDQALETGMAAFSDPLAAGGALGDEGDGLDLGDLDAVSFDPTNLESTSAEFGESAELSPLGELDGDLDDLFLESLLPDSDLDETKKE